VVNRNLCGTSYEARQTSVYVYVESLVSSRVLGISNDDAHFDSHCVTNPATLYPLGDSKGVMVLTTQCHTGSDYRISYCL